MSPTPPLPPHRPPFSYPFPAPEDRKMGLHYSKKFILTELIFCRRDQPWSSCAGLPMEIWTLNACLVEWEGGSRKRGWRGLRSGWCMGGVRWGCGCVWGLFSGGVLYDLSAQRWFKDKIFVCLNILSFYSVILFGIFQNDSP